MSGYLFDASSLVEVLRSEPSPTFVERLRLTATRDRFTTALVVGELMLHARRAVERKVMTDVLRLVAAVRVAPFDVAAARTYAKLGASLEWAKSPLAPADLATLAVARTLDLVLVTRRPFLFASVPDAKVEDWCV